MKKYGFTIIEIMGIVFIIGMLTLLGYGRFKRARESHRIDTLIQELTVLRTAILSYKELHGKLPVIATEVALSSSCFNALKPFWYPFRPENSKVLECGEWVGKLDNNEDNSYLAIKKDGVRVAFNFELLEKKMQKLCCVDDSGTYFHILESWDTTAFQGLPDAIEPP